MSQTIITNGYTPEGFKELFKEAFQELVKLNPNIVEAGISIDGSTIIGRVNPKEKELKERYLTRGQVSKLLQISLPTLHNYTKQGIITAHRLGSQVRYKAAEIEKALVERSYLFKKKGGGHAA